MLLQKLIKPKEDLRKFEVSAARGREIQDHDSTSESRHLLGSLPYCFLALAWWTFLWPVGSAVSSKIYRISTDSGLFVVQAAESCSLCFHQNSRKDFDSEGKGRSQSPSWKRIPEIGWLWRRLICGSSRSEVELESFLSSLHFDGAWWVKKWSSEPL